MYQLMLTLPNHDSDMRLLNIQLSQGPTPVTVDPIKEHDEDDDGDDDDDFNDDAKHPKKTQTADHTTPPRGSRANPEPHHTIRRGRRTTPQGSGRTTPQGVQGGTIIGGRGGRASRDHLHIYVYMYVCMYVYTYIYIYMYLYRKMYFGTRKAR